MSLESESAKMNARKDNFLETLCDQRPDFGKHILRPRASSRPAHMGNDAVGAVGIASILQFDKRASLASGLRHRRQQIIAAPIERSMDYFALRIRLAIIRGFRAGVLCRHFPQPG